MTGEEIARRLPAFQGRLSLDAELAPFNWFRTGGRADVLASPRDEDDLAYLLRALPAEVPVTAIGVGSNLIVRDGGLRGVVVRLGGRAFNAVEFLDGHRVRAGAAVLDAQLARQCAAAGVAGFSFLRGVPGALGGALRMNAGAHGGEIKDRLIEATGFDRSGARRTFSLAEMGYAYRHSALPDDVILTTCLMQGFAGETAALEAEMEHISRLREESQPIREKTGGSTFKNPAGEKAWKLIDAAGCRGLVVGDAQVSQMHCNFLINRGAATSADIEALGEEVRRRVRETSGVVLEWEIRRIGEAAAN